MTHTTITVPGVVAIFDRGDMVVKIMGTTNGHEVATVKHTLEIVRPITLEVVYELVEQCGLGRDGLLVVIDGTRMIFRASVTGTYAVFPRVLAKGTPFADYLDHFDNPGYHPDARSGEQVEIATMSLWEPLPHPER